MHRPRSGLEPEISRPVTWGSTPAIRRQHTTLYCPHAARSIFRTCCSSILFDLATNLVLHQRANGMALNPDKSHAILLGTTQRAQSFSGLQSIDVAGPAISLVRHIKLLGVTLDSHLTMSEHTKLVTVKFFLPNSCPTSHMWSARSVNCYSHSLSLNF